MRILQISTSDKNGGAELVGWNLHHSFLDEGHDAWLAVGWKRSTDERAIQIVNEKRGAWWRACERVRRAAYRRSIRLLPRMISLLMLADAQERRMRGALRVGAESFYQFDSERIPDLIPLTPDIIHAHNLHLGYFNLSALPRLSAQAPFVLTLHDAWLLSGHCCHSLDCDRWKSGCGECPYLSVFPEISVDRTAHNWNRKRDIFQRSQVYVATPCRWLMTKLEQSILRPAVVETRLIPYGIDLSIFTPGDRLASRHELGIEADAHVVLFSANGIGKNGYKDFETLRDAFPVASKRLKQKKIVFLGVGRKASSKRTGNMTIQFAPFEGDPASVARYYRAADVYVHSAKADTFPNMVLEAQACACPVIATQVGGIPEQIRHSETGFLVPPREPEMIANHIVDVLTKPDLARAVGGAAAEYVRLNHALRRMAQDYLSWFQEILSRRHTQPPETQRKNSASF